MNNEDYIKIQKLRGIPVDEPNEINEMVSYDGLYKEGYDGLNQFQWNKKVFLDPVYYLPKNKVENEK